jgi:hypothetical protein
VSDNPDILACAHCDLPFVRRRPAQVTCSPACSRAHYLRRQREYQQAIRDRANNGQPVWRGVFECTVCGTPFGRSGMRTQAATCGPECSKVHAVRAQAARQERADAKRLAKRAETPPPAFDAPPKRLTRWGKRYGRPPGVPNPSDAKKPGPKPGAPSPRRDKKRKPKRKAKAKASGPIKCEYVDNIAALKAKAGLA